MLRIYLKLNEHFIDVRANSYILIPPELKTIEDLKMHIVQMFDIWLDFSLFKEDDDDENFFLRPDESVTILTDNDTVWVKPNPLPYDKDIIIDPVPVAEAEEILREYPKDHTVESFILDIMPYVTDGSQLHLTALANQNRSFTMHQMYTIHVQGRKKMSKARALGRGRMIVHLAVPPAENNDSANNWIFIIYVVVGIFVLFMIYYFLASNFF